MDAFYEPLDEDRFAATGHTTGPWGDDSQHLGPPSALLVRALERCAPRPEAVLSRVVFEVLGPVPVAELTVTASVERPGRSVELLTAELAHERPPGAAGPRVADRGRRHGGGGVRRGLRRWSRRRGAQPMAVPAALAGRLPGRHGVAFGQRRHLRAR